MPVNSRAKGARVERQIAIELELLTGIGFQRNLEQVRSVDQSDLIPSDPAWPFAVEIKARASGTGCKPAWKAQSERAAKATNRFPCVIYRYDRKDAVVALPMAAFGYDCPEWFETSVAGLAYIAAEIMAGRS